MASCLHDGWWHFGAASKDRSFDADAFKQENDTEHGVVTSYLKTHSCFSSDS